MAGRSLSCVVASLLLAAGCTSESGGAADGGPVGPGGACTADEQCPTGDYCDDVQCPIGQTCGGCQAGVPNCFAAGGLVDGGPCGDDSQCPAGDYCDFGYGSLRLCFPDAGLTPESPFVIDSGVCLPASTCTLATGTAVYTIVSCHFSEQCPEADTCLTWSVDVTGGAEGTPCTPAAPCGNGECSSLVGCSGPVTACPPPCKAVTVPHMSCDQICACPASFCASADGG